MEYLNYTNYENYYNITLSAIDRQEADRYLNDISVFIESEVGKIFILKPNTSIQYVISYCEQSYLPIPFWQANNLIISESKHTLNLTNDNLAVKSLNLNCNSLRECSLITVSGTYGYSDGLPDLLKNSIYKALKLHLTVYSGATINNLGNLVEERSLTMTRKKVYTNQAQNYNFKAIIGEIPTNIKQMLSQYKPPLTPIITGKCKEQQLNCKKC